MFRYLFRNTVLAFLIALLAVGYYLWKNGKNPLPDRGVMNREKNELIAAARKQYANLSLQEIEAKVNEKLLAAASISAMTAEAAKANGSSDAYKRAVAAYGESAQLVSGVDDVLALRYRFMKGRTLYEFGRLFPENPETPKAVEEGVRIIRSVMGEWDAGMGADLPKEMQAILDEYRQRAGSLAKDTAGTARTKE